MIRRPRLMTLTAGTVLSFVFGTVYADVPAAMDRVPSEAAIVISVKNIGQLKSGVDALAKALGIPAEQMQGMSKMGEVLNMQGADAAGSAAIGIMSLDEDEDEPPAVAVVPVKDYAAFVKNFGGTGTGVEELRIDEKPVFAKSLDGGFAAVGSKKELVQSFAGKTGNGKLHEAALGSTGKSIAETDDLVIVANIAKFGDKIKEGAQGFKEQMGTAMAMAGGGEANLAGLDKLIDGLVRDGSVAVVGFKVSEAGVTLDLGAQFKEGSEFASYFNSKGNAGRLVSALPKQAFLFALGMDTSDPNLRAMFKNIKEAAAKMNPKKDAAEGPGMFPMDWTEGADGIAVEIGNTPQPLGGLFLNTTAYVKTSKPGDLLKKMKDSITASNGKAGNGATLTTAYESGVKAGGTTADAWSIKFAADENDPNSAMVSQAMGMLFGPNGLNGYAADAGTGVVLTYSKNSALLEKSLAAAKSGEGLAADPDVATIAAGLPANRTVEAYLGTKSLLELGLTFLGMMGQAPADVNIPDDVPPVGLAATTNGGGARMTVVVPTKVIQAVKTLADSMNMGEPEEEKMGPKDKKAGQPKF